MYAIHAGSWITRVMKSFTSNAAQHRFTCLFRVFPNIGEALFSMPMIRNGSINVNYKQVLTARGVGRCPAKMENPFSGRNDPILLANPQLLVNIDAVSV